MDVFFQVLKKQQVCAYVGASKTVFHLIAECQECFNPRETQGEVPAFALLCFWPEVVGQSESGFLSMERLDTCRMSGIKLFRHD